jgi:phytoene/squalene synthetase
MTPVDRWNALRDALKLAEQSAPYIDGEQWAVAAVIFLRREVVTALKACAGTTVTANVVLRSGDKTLALHIEPDSGHVLKID